MRMAGARTMISKQEWRWAAAVAVAVMVLTTIPYLVAAGNRDAQWRFSGFLIGVEDGNSYLAKMGQGARDGWAYKLAYSSETQAGAVLFLFHFALGKLAGTSPAAEIVVYHVARGVFGLLLLLVSYAFLAHFLPRVQQRRLALAWVAVGGGLGWLLILLRQSDFYGSLPLDLYSPEGFGWLTLFGLPHLALARALLLLGLLAYLNGRGLWAGLALLGASLIQPLYVIAIWAVMGVDTLWAMFWLAGQDRLRSLLKAALAIVLSTPYVAYTVYVFSVDPVLRQWNLQNRLPSPNPIHYVVAYGPYLALAVGGWFALRRRQPRLARFAAGWLLIAPVLVYLPIPTQRRLIEGLWVPLVALAVLGLTVALHRWRAWLVPLLVVLALPTTLILWLGSFGAALRPAEPVFVPAGQHSVFAWLADHASPGQVAISAYETGNLLPAYTPLTAYVGHGPETVYLQDKLARVTAFYSAGTPDVGRQTLLVEGRISYVLYGPRERALGTFDPAGASYLAPLFSSGDYQVYAVVQ